jgi:hypothetical protein
MPSDCSAEGAGDETNGERRERGKGGSRSAQFRKEQRAKEDGRSGRKDKEVEILNGLRENCDDNHPSLGARAFVAEVQSTVTRVVVRRRVRNVSHLVSGGYVSATVSDASDFLRIAMIPPPMTSAMPKTTKSVGARSQMTQSISAVKTMTV